MMKKVFLLIIIMMLFLMNSVNAATIKFKYNDPSANVQDMVNDTWIQSASVNTNYGTSGGVDSNVNMGCDSATSVGRSMFRFAVYPNIPSGSTIDAVTLNISEGTYCYVGGVPYTGQFKANLHRIITAWINTEPTWNNFNDASGHYTSYVIDEYIGNCNVLAKDANNNNHMIFNGVGLIDYVRGVTNGTYSDYGFYIKLDNEICTSTAPNETSVYMSDHATVDLHPSLTIDYTEQQSSTTTYESSSTTTTIQEVSSTTTTIQEVSSSTTTIDLTTTIELTTTIGPTTTIEQTTTTVVCNCIDIPKNIILEPSKRCIDNSTLRYEWVYCNNTCYGYKSCLYGCDSSLNDCIINPLIFDLSVLGVIFSIIILVYFFKIKH